MAGLPERALCMRGGAMGLVLGPGYPDLGLSTVGVPDLSCSFRIRADLLHIGPSGFALLSGLRWGRA